MQLLARKKKVVLQMLRYNNLEGTYRGCIKVVGASSW